MHLLGEYERAHRVTMPRALRRVVPALVLFAAIGDSAWGQVQSSPSGSRAIQLPLSGLQPGGTMVQQSSTPPPGSSVNALSTQIQVQGSYSGSIPGKDVPSGTMILTLEDAVRRGLATNLGVVDAGTASTQARAQRLQALSALLPNISASVAEVGAKVNLAAEGFSASTLGSSASFSFPTTVGPYRYFDLHGSLQQNVMDFTAIHNLRSADRSAEAAGLNARQAREEVVLAVVGVYLQLMATQAQVEQQQIEVQYAEATYKQAQAQSDAGNKAPIDANRSLVELQTERQRLRSQQGDLSKQKNQLARIIGIPLGLDVQLTEKLLPLESEISGLDQAIRTAWTQRQDLKASEAQLRGAEEARKAAGAEHLPTASINGQFGLQGVGPDSASGVFQAAATLSMPIFQGGRIRADTIQADAAVTQRRAELADERGAVELDVRNAYIDLGVANDQVATAEANRKLALETLQQSQDRFAAGVADSVEVVNSQEALAAANHDYVSSLFSQYLSRIALAHAMGEAENDLPALFKRN